MSGSWRRDPTQVTWYLTMFWPRTPHRGRELVTRRGPFRSRAGAERAAREIRADCALAIQQWEPGRGLRPFGDEQTGDRT